MIYFKKKHALAIIYLPKCRRLTHANEKYIFVRQKSNLACNSHDHYHCWSCLDFHFFILCLWLIKTSLKIDTYVVHPFSLKLFPCWILPTVLWSQGSCAVILLSGLLTWKAAPPHQVASPNARSSWNRLHQSRACPFLNSQERDRNEDTALE